MNTNNTQTRNQCFVSGDIALLKVIEDLIKRGLVPLTPFTEQHPFDIVAMDAVASVYYRIQVKYGGRKSNRKNVPSGKHYNRGKASKGYQPDSFDYYAIYIPEKDVVIYPPISLRGKSFRISASRRPFYWYKDFLEFSQAVPPKRNAKDVGEYFHPVKHKVKHSTKVEWPSKEELTKLVWEKPTTQLSNHFGVSDVAISKWCKSYGIPKPPRGYWAKQQSGSPARIRTETAQTSTANTL